MDAPSLLLLPFPPTPPTRQSVVDVAYRPPLTAALSRLTRPDRASRLVVAVPCSVAQHSWPEAQSLVAAVYAVVAAVCARLAIPSDVGAGAGSVDATVILVEHDRQDGPRRNSSPTAPRRVAVVDLATFAAAWPPPWDLVFQVRSEAGIELAQAFLALYEGRQQLRQDQLVPVPGGLVVNGAEKGGSEQSPATEVRQPTTVCLGGTFDHLHPGHKLLLTAAALLLSVPGDDSSHQPTRLIIGITGDEMLRNKKFAEYVEPWAVRAQNVLSFLATLLLDGPPKGPETATAGGELSRRFRDGRVVVRCVRIDDAFGPTVTEEDMDMLVVSGETRAGGGAVNERRRELGWHALEVYEVDVLDAGDGDDSTAGGEQGAFAAKISSTAIRQQRAAARAASS